MASRDARYTVPRHLAGKPWPLQKTRFASSFTNSSRTTNRMGCVVGIYMIAILVGSGLLSAEQLDSLSPLTLPQAVEAASKNYPSIRVSQEQMNAAAEGIRLARTAYLPRVDALAQVNRATRNNVFGLLLPQNVIPSMSGPVIGSNNTGSVWGSSVGGLVTWEPFDFGLRASNVGIAAAARVQSEAAVKRTQFEVSVATVDAYLTLVAA